MPVDDSETRWIRIYELRNGKVPTRGREVEKMKKLADLALGIVLIAGVVLFVYGLFSYLANDRGSMATSMMIIGAAVVAGSMATERRLVGRPGADGKARVKKSLLSLNTVAVTIGYATVLYYIGSCTYGNLNREHRVDPAEAVRIGVLGVVAEAYSPRSMHGDGATMAVWNTFSSSEDLLSIVDRSRIERGRIWFAGPFDANARAAFDWLTGAGEYAFIWKHVDQIMSDRYFYAIDTLNLQGNAVYNASIWIVSPEHRLIAYMDRDT
jgi:hypothetical protein